jgi:hypothetical protein
VDKVIIVEYHAFLFMFLKPHREPHYECRAAEFSSSLAYVFTEVLSSNFGPRLQVQTRSCSPDLNSNWTLCRPHKRHLHNKTLNKHNYILGLQL